MEKSKTKVEKPSIGRKIFLIFVKFFGFLAVLVCLGFCTLMSNPIIVYDKLAASDALSLSPPIYPNSVEIISGASSYAGSGGLAAKWVYCTDASIDVLIVYFEPYMGEFKLMGSLDDGYYYAWISSQNQIVESLSNYLDLGGYAGTFELYVLQDDERCTTNSTYVYRINYAAH